MTSLLLIVAVPACIALWVALRLLRWQYLLRVAGVRVPIRESAMGLLAALPGVFVPYFSGEVLRVAFMRGASGERVARAGLVFVADHAADFAALWVLALWSSGEASTATIVIAMTLFVVPVVTMARSASKALRSNSRATAALVGSLAMSLAAWAPLAFVSAVAVDGFKGFATTTGRGAESILHATSFRWSEPVGATIAFIGTLLLLRLVIRRIQPSGARRHFDEIASDYIHQWAGHVWRLLLKRRMDLLDQTLEHLKPGVGLDLGCGLGHQANEMRKRGFRVIGVDPAIDLLRVGASHHPDVPVATGDALVLPLPDNSVDFVYAIGVLHHLPCVHDQQRAYREINRVLKPGGRLVVQETNTRNPLFLFYMSYLFPLMKTIDEGVEWWIDPRSWARVPGFDLRRIEHFTFLPDFIPERLLAPALKVEKWLEQGNTRHYSVHYMAVLDKCSAAGATVDRTATLYARAI